MPNKPTPNDHNSLRALDVGSNIMLKCLASSSPNCIVSATESSNWIPYFPQLKGILGSFRISILQSIFWQLSDAYAGCF